jgi:hypothetical protein
MLDTVIHKIVRIIQKVQSSEWTKPEPGPPDTMDRVSDRADLLRSREVRYGCQVHCPSVSLYRFVQESDVYQADFLNVLLRPTDVKNGHTCFVHCFRRGIHVLRKLVMQSLVYGCSWRCLAMVSVFRHEVHFSLFCR